MSYLNPVRIHFAGRFRADVSTINNQADRFDNSDFVIPEDQRPGSGQSGGMWQPAGTGAWRIDQCTVTGASLGGKPVSRDPVLGLEIRDSGDRVAAKLVDLDPYQQMASTIFGLEVRIVDPVAKTVLMRGSFKPAPFFDIWFGRGLQSSGDMGASAFFQSVLTDVEWGDTGASPVFAGLRSASQEGMLSIKFMTDAYSMGLPKRGFGRIVGTIGPHLPGDPSHFTPGRFLAPMQPQLGPGPVTAPLGYVGCWVDQANRQVIADFGNAIPTGLGGLIDVGPLHLMVPYGSKVLDLGQLKGYTAPSWYEQTAGIQAFPPDRSLTDSEMSILAANPLCVGSPLANPDYFSAFAAEAPDGIFLRPDEFVYRLEPGKSQDVRVMALQFGQPLSGAAVTATVSGFGLQPTGPNDPPPATPEGAVSVSDAAAIQTRTDGWATIRLATTDPGLPRIPDGKPGDGVDGQVYAVELGVAGAQNAGTSFWQSACFVSVLLFSKVEAPATVTWGDAQPILLQYSNLYPRPHGRDRYVPYRDKPPLHPVVNLSDEADVGNYAPMISRALQLPIEHPNHMPVTRDLSAGRRQILLDYMQLVIDGPYKSANDAAPSAMPTKPAQAPVRDFALERGADDDSSEGGAEPEEQLGGKTIARNRMLAAAARAFRSEEK
jgi:hypothetical protein